MTAPPAIFDPLAVTAARARALARYRADPAGAADFLLARVAEDVSDRLSLIRRKFNAPLDLCTDCRLFADRLVSDHGLTTLIHAGSGACRTSTSLVVDLERLPFAPRSFDLIVSGLALHTVNDLPGTLAQICASLLPDGLFLAALMGGSTLRELRVALLEAETEITGGASPRVAPAVDVRDLGSLLQRAGFALPVVDSDVVTVTYADPLALMHDLRAMGATNTLTERSRRVLRRDVLARALDIYRQRFAAPDGRVSATFEILTATAWAPHPRQQQPLAPGSAKTRLADALSPKKPASDT